MKNLVWIFIAACIFAACSDDDGPKTPPVEYDVISFEPAEGMLDFKGNAAAPRTVTIVGEWAGGSFDDVLCGREYMNEEDANGNFFDGLLFTTADRKIGFGSYFCDMSKNQFGAYDTWGGFALSKNYSQTPTAEGRQITKGAIFRRGPSREPTIPRHSPSLISTITALMITIRRRSNSARRGKSPICIWPMRP